MEGKSGATISRTLASLKNFYAYVISTGFLEESPVSGEIHVDRGEKKLPQILTGKEAVSYTHLDVYKRQVLP